MGHGRALININDHDTQISAYEKVISESLSVRATEDLVRSLTNKEKPVSKKATKAAPEYVAEGTNQIADFFGAKIDVKASANGKGKISIPFSSKEDFNRILKLLKRE